MCLWLKACVPSPDGKEGRKATQEGHQGTVTCSAWKQRSRVQIQTLPLLAVTLGDVLPSSFAGSPHLQMDMGFGSM